MKKVLGIVVLGLFIITPSQADEISDFKVEGISIGDSALNFFDESEIKNNSWDYYDDKTFTPVQIDNKSFFQTYDSVDFAYKTNDDNYVIYKLSGVISYEKNVNECYKRMNEIAEEISENFENAVNHGKVVTEAPFDKKSKKTDIEFKLKSGRVIIACYDYSKKDGGQDHLAISLSSDEFYLWLQTKAYN